MPEIKDCSIVSQEQEKKSLTSEEIKKEQENFLGMIVIHLENLKKILKLFFLFCQEKKIRLTLDNYEEITDDIEKFFSRLKKFFKDNPDLLIHNRCHLTHILGNCQFSLACYLRRFNKYSEDEKEKETEKVKKSLELLSFYLETLLENNKALKTELTTEDGGVLGKEAADVFLEDFKEKWEKENKKNTEK